MGSGAAAALQQTQEQVARDREQPSAHVTLVAPSRPAGDGVLQRVLDEVVGGVAVAQQCESVTPKARDLWLQHRGNRIEVPVRVLLHAASLRRTVPLARATIVPQR